MKLSIPAILLVLPLFLFQLFSETSHAQECSRWAKRVCVGDVVYCYKGSRPCQPVTVTAIGEHRSMGGLRPLDLVYVTPQDPYNSFYFSTSLSKTRKECLRDYAEANGASPPASASSGRGGRSCTSTRQCGYDQSCIQGHCVSNGGVNQYSPAHPCAGGEQCVNGACVP